MGHRWVTEDSAAGPDDVVPSGCECGKTFLVLIPAWQWSAALPTQHGIVLDLLNAALAMRMGSAATKRHKKHKMPSEMSLCFMCFFVAN
ncbi:MAG TPA: hypothetical protein VF088_03560 [Pyrinomonadaceae bacterium]